MMTSLEAMYPRLLALLVSGYPAEGENGTVDSDLTKAYAANCSGYERARVVTEANELLRSPRNVRSEVSQAVGRQWESEQEVRAWLTGISLVMAQTTGEPARKSFGRSTTRHTL